MARASSRPVLICVSLCVFVLEPFFPRISPWKAALLGTVPVLGILIIGLSYIGWKEHQAKEREVKNREKKSKERDLVKKAKEEASKTKGELRQQYKSEIKENLRR